MRIFYVLFFIISNLSLTSCYKTEADKNVENSERIKLGMRTYQVLEIMGNPKNIKVSNLDNQEFSYKYSTPFGHSDNIYIFFNNDSSVVRIANGL